MAQVWHSKSLGDGMWADIPSEEIKQFFQPLFESAGKSAEMAVFVRHEEGNLHCNWVAYFSPEASEVAKAVEAIPCSMPMREGLNLLAGRDECWAALFEHSGLSNARVIPAKQKKEILLKRLRTFEFLRGLDSALLENLAQKSAWKVFAANEIIFWEGDQQSNLYYLQYGSLKVLKSSPDGRQQVLRFINTGEMFNEIAALAGRPNPATAITLEESGLWLIPRGALEEIILAQPQVALQIITNMADKIIGLATLASDLSLKTVEARFALLLLNQSEGDVIPRRRWTNQTELAAYLGTVPDVLSRIIREMKKAGLIKMDKQQIRILDREGLQTRAMQE